MLDRVISKQGVLDYSTPCRGTIDITAEVADGRLGLSTWQGLFLYERRLAEHRRRISVTCIGSS